LGDVGYAILDLAQRYTPEVMGIVTEASLWFTELSILHRQLASEQSRRAEDLRDIAERMKVVQRVNREYLDVLGRYNRSHSVLSQAVSYQSITTRDNPLRGRYDSVIEKEAPNKASLQQQLKSKIIEFLDVKEKFASYKKRKIREGLQGYFSALKRCLESEAKIAEKMRPLLEMLIAGPPDVPDEFRRFEELFRGAEEQRRNVGENEGNEVLPVNV
jgi:hypothetical protein